MKNILFILILSFSFQCFAEDDVLAEAQAMMMDRKQMDKLAQVDPNVKKSDEFVNQVVGTGKEKDELLKISADVLAALVKKHNGDVDAMQADLLQAIKDPKKFLESLNPDQRGKIRNLASEVEKKNKVPMAAPKP